jgi:ABC-type multidrug transport system fused ATPase/permease subunit
MKRSWALAGRLVFDGTAAATRHRGQQQQQFQFQFQTSLYSSSAYLYRTTTRTAKTVHGNVHRYYKENQWRLKSTLATTTASSEEPSSISNSNSSNNDAKDDNKKPSLSRLLELSKQEWTLIALSASTLAVTSSVTLLMPYASGSVIDYTMMAPGGGDDGSMYSPMVLAGGLFGLNALAAAGVYLRTLWLSRAGNRIVARLKQQLYASLLKQDSAWLDQQTTGDLLSRLTADAQMVQSAVTTQAVAGLRGVVMSAGAAAMLLYTSPVLAAISCGTLPPIFILSRHYGRQLSKEQEKVQSLLGEATTLAEQSLSSVSTVKQFVAEDFEANRYRNSISAAHQTSVDTSHMQAKLEAGAHISGNAAVLAVLGYGGSLVLEGGMSAGDLTGFVMYSFLLAGNLSSLTSVYSDVVRAVAASDRILTILDRPPIIPMAITGSPKALEHKRLADLDPLQQVEYFPDEYNGTRLAVVEDSTIITTASSSPTSVQQTTRRAAPLIELRNLNFQYPARPDVNVLKNFSLTIQPGEVVALVGGSGSGKSTVASLLTRLYDPSDTTSIQLDGTPLAEYDLQHVRHMIGVVSQDPVLFRGSIRENIRYGEWDKVSDEDILHAAQQANVLDFAKQFPEGLDTMVGPRGLQLSGGQRQRIALARVLAKNAPILILDEATSALDAQSEYLVQKALEQLFVDENRSDGRTIVSIAHRLSTIRHASRIAVVQDGAIVQTGTFDELRFTPGPFRELMKTQLVGDVHDD